MSQSQTPVLTGRSFADPALICLAPLTLLCLAIGGGILVVGGHNEGVVGVVVGVVSAFFFVREWRAVSRSRLWIHDLGTGLRVETRRGYRDVADKEVVGFASCERLSYHTGRVTGADRSATLVTADGEKIELRYRLRNHDPLAELLSRLAGRVRGSADRALAAGKPIHGDGWRYSPAGLEVERDDCWVMVPIVAISAAEVTGRHLCVWEGADREPVLRVPDSGVNVAFLAAVLRDLPFSAVAVPGLGRHLFTCELGWRRGQIVAAVTVAVLLVLGGFALPAFGGDAVPGVFGVIPLVMGTGIGIFAARSNNHRLHCYSKGVRIERWLDGTRTVEFDGLSWFTYSAVQRYIDGAYVGTMYELVLQRAEGARLRVALSSTTRDAGLDEVVNRIASRFADRWCAGFAKGREQQWFGNTVLTPNGLRVSKREVARYSGLTLLTIENGRFKIFDSAAALVLGGETSSPNFFAGLAAMNRMGARLG